MKPALLETTFDSRPIRRTVILGVLVVGLLRANGMIAHIAAGQGWTTTITLVNTSTFAQPTTVWFWDSGGSPMTLNVTGLGATTGYTFTLAAHQIGVAELTGSPTRTQAGYATVVGRTVQATPYSDIQFRTTRTSKRPYR
jgi:hypothetical protein